jgi:hypothetical protein
MGLLPFHANARRRLTVAAALRLLLSRPSRNLEL